MQTRFGNETAEIVMAVAGTLDGQGKFVAGPSSSVMAGERNIGSIGNSYVVHRPETNGSVLTGVAGAFAVSNGLPAHLVAITNHGAAANAGTITITGLTDLTGVAQPLVIAAGALTALQRLAFDWARCETNLTITLSNAADKVLVNWRPI